jgi:outer membrane immunogenic protein
MKRVLAPAALILLMSTAAFAADIPAFEPAPQIAPPPAGFTWTGPYIGLFAGYAWTDIEVTDVDNFNQGGFGRTFEFESDGFYGGAMAGYNYQWNWLVLGVEGEIAYLNLDDGRQDPLIAEIPLGREDDSIASFETDFYGSITGRLGVGFDRILVYARGGVAFANVEASFRDDSFDDVVGSALDNDDSDSDTLVGFTIGGGAEFALTQNVTLRGEYMFTDLGDEVSTTQTDVLGREFRFDQEIDDLHLVKVGVSYKF